MKKTTMWGRLALALSMTVVVGMLIVSAPKRAEAFTAQVVSKTFSATGTGASILIRHGKTFTYSVTGTQVGTTVLERSVDGSNYAVALSTKNNSGTYSGTILVETPTRGPAYYRFRQDAYTSGSAITVLTEQDDLVQSFYNYSGEANLKLYDGHVEVPGTLTVTGGMDASNLAASSVVTAKLASDAVISAKISDSAVTTNKVAPGAITTAKVAQDAVTSVGLLTGAVVTDKLAASSVITAKMFLDLPAMQIPCVTTAKRLGSCSSINAATGVCNNCN